MSATYHSGHGLETVGLLDLVEDEGTEGTVESMRQAIQVDGENNTFAVSRFENGGRRTQRLLAKKAKEQVTRN